MWKTSILTNIREYMYDHAEQKRPDGCVLTNSPNATSLRPDSTFIGGRSKVITQRIVVGIAITFQNSSIIVEPGSKGVSFGGFVKTHPSARYFWVISYNR